MKSSIRKAICAGSWYERDPYELQEELRLYLKNVKYLGKTVKAVIVPHAGYMYSGQVAAYSFKQLPAVTKKIIIMGTMHHYYMKGVCALDYEYLETPLGNIKVSNDVKDLISKGIAEFVPEADTYEHSIEIELPFLKYCLKDFEIVPLLVGDVDSKWLANKLISYIDKNTVVVVSVDLSHFYTYNEAIKLDKKTIDTIISLDESSVPELEIDSPYAVMTLINICKILKWTPELLIYKNSGDISGDKNRVVGYASIIFY
ncbi:MAG: AmmeMemoRadiSam system protein B [Ignavibacteria bacterium]|nr:AmmeMemoRadiSam system protein B [Ignavibacteria bacterium]